MMVKLKMGRYLKTDTAHEQLAETHIGQAHIAGEGPRGTTCRECEHWGFEGYRANFGGKGGELKNAPCKKGRGQKFPHDALACKRFEKPEEGRRPPLAFAKVNS